MTAVDPDGVRQALTDIYEAEGSLTAELVVDVASDPRSPLHYRFEWDDDIAGHQFRLVQARHLIGTFRIVADQRPQCRTRAFVHSRSLESYVPVEVVVNDRDLRAEQVERIKSELRTFRLKLRGFQEFAQIADEIDRLED